MAPAFKSTDSTTQTKLTQCGRKKRANLESKLHRKLHRERFEVHLLRTTYSQRSPGSFLIPPSPYGTKCVKHSHGALSSHTIDFCGSEALGHASLVCTLDFSRLDTMYLPVPQRIIITAQVPSIHAFPFFFNLNLNI